MQWHISRPTYMLLCCTCGPRRMCALKMHWLNTNRRPCLHKLHMCLLVLIRAAMKLPSATWVVWSEQRTTCSSYCFTHSQKMLQNSIDLCHMHIYIVSFPSLCIGIRPSLCILHTPWLHTQLMSYLPRYLVADLHSWVVHPDMQLHLICGSLSMTTLRRLQWCSYNCIVYQCIFAAC